MQGHHDISGFVVPTITAGGVVLMVSGESAIVSPTTHTRAQESEDA
jgi:hypothetical protein